MFENGTGSHACGLREKRNHITTNEDGGEPASADYRVLFSMRELDEATQDHVDGRSE